MKIFAPHLSDVPNYTLEPAISVEYIHHVDLPRAPTRLIKIAWWTNAVTEEVHINPQR